MPTASATTAALLAAPGASATAPAPIPVASASFYQCWDLNFTLYVATTAGGSTVMLPTDMGSQLLQHLQTLSAQADLQVGAPSHLLLTGCAAAEAARAAAALAGCAVAG